MSTEIFKVGDSVFELNLKYCKILELLSDSAKVVSDENEIAWVPYTYLSFTPYDLINGGWSQDRSVLNQPKKGDLVYVRDSEAQYWTMGIFSHKEDSLFMVHNGNEKSLTGWLVLSIENPLLKEK